MTQSTLPHHDPRHARSQKRAIMGWAMRVFRDEGPHLRPRIAVARGAAIDGFAFDRSIGLRGLVQAAALVLRVGERDDLVLALSPGRMGAGLEAQEWGAVADVRSGGGVRELVMLAGRPTAGAVQYRTRPLPPSLVEHLGDWAAVHHAVNVVLPLDFHRWRARLAGAPDPIALWARS